MSDEKNPYALYPDEEMDRRPRYYDGQFLGSADFIDAQRYDIDRRRRHIQATTTPGVVAGLDVTGASDAVRIAPGAAVDDAGRQIVLVAEEQKGIIEADRGENLLLYIAYRETTSDQSHAEQGTSGHTRFHEMPVIDYVVEGAALPARAVVLARLQVDASGNVTADGAVRPRAGLRVPGATPLTLTSDDGDPGRGTLRGALAVRVPDGTTHDPSHPALRVAGHGIVDGTLLVGHGAPSGYAGVDVAAGGLAVNGPLAAAGNSAVRGLGVGYAPVESEGGLLARRAAIGRNQLVGDLALHVEGKAGVTGNAAIGGALTVARELTVEQPSTLRSTLAVSGATRIGGNTSVTGTLSATGDATLGGELDLAGTARLGAMLYVTRGVRIGGGLIMGNRLEVQNRADVTGALTVGSTARIGGDTAITGALSATGALTAGGAATIGGAGSVGGALSVGSNITMRGDTLDLGAGRAGREQNAGKIKYGVHQTDALEIFGAGTGTNNRKLHVYAEGGTTLTGGLSTGGGISAGGAVSVSGDLSATGALTVNGAVVFKKGLVVGQTENEGYKGVTNDVNDLVVNGQFAAGGSGGAAMYSLGIGYEAPGGKEGRLHVADRLGVGTADPAQRLHVDGNVEVTGWTRAAGTTYVAEGTGNGIRFRDDIGGGSGDWAGLRYWAYDGENTRLELGTGNDPLDIIVLRQNNFDALTVAHQRVAIGGDPLDGTRLTVYGHLKVTGNISIGDDHNVAMTPGGRSQVSWAAVNSDQSLWNGRGISDVARHDKGWYQVRFSPAFSGIPAVVVTQHGTGNTKDNCLVSHISGSSCMVKTGDSSGDRSDRAFTLIAVGNK